MIETRLPPAGTATLDLQRFGTAHTVNYLHRAAALDLCQGGHLTASLELLQEYCRSQQSSKVDLRDFEQVLDDSIRWRGQFRLLRCRGFSYQLDLNMRGYDRQFLQRWRLCPDVDFRLALIPAQGLYYPQRIRDFLANVPWTRNHYFVRGAPSIAFALGRKSADAWLVAVMQSDLAGEAPAFLRDHFRGWRKVLFANIVAQARHQVRALYLPRAIDVERTRIGVKKGPPSGSSAWGEIYDRTAHEWGMKPVRLDRPVNVQVLRCGPPVFTDELFELTLPGPARS